MNRPRRFRRRGKRFATAGEGPAAPSAPAPENDLQGRFTFVIAALANLKKAESDFRLTKETALEKMAFDLASQSQSHVDSDELLAWKQSVLAAEAKRADLLSAFELAEEELCALAKAFAKKDAPGLLKTIEELLEAHEAAKTSGDPRWLALVHTEEFLHALKRTAETSDSGKKAERKRRRKSEEII